MSHQNESNSRKCSELSRCLQWLFARTDWGGGVHASSTWTFRMLAAIALAWGWSREQTLKERFKCGQRLARHIYSDQQSFSYQAFIEALKRHSDRLTETLKQTIRRRMMQFGDYWQYADFVLFGIDGSEINVPRTTDHKLRLTSNGKSPHQKRKKKKKEDKQRESPRFLWTTIFHIQLGLPWNWCLGSKNEGERKHVLSMLSDLPKNSLLAGDCGFVGYDFLSKVLDSGADILVRIGSNVKLLRKLGYTRECNGIVYVWPNKAARKNQPPLRLRLVISRGPRSLLYMVTSVHEHTRLSDDQVGEIYFRRWEIELYHRHFKQTFGCKKALSTTTDNAMIELKWKLFSLWTMLLYALQQTIKAGHSPDRLSPAKVIMAFTATARDYLHESEKGNKLTHQLATAVKDSYKRTGKKDAIDYPRQRKHRPPGSPIIEIATPSQRKAAKALMEPATKP